MKYAIITGANGGLGSFISRKLLEDNYFVIMLYHTNDDKVKELHELYPNNTFCYKCDITKEDEVENIKNILNNKNINIDLLINNAGIDTVGDLYDKTLDTFMNTYKVNAIGAFFMIKYFGDDIDLNHGDIINVSSDNAVDKYDVYTLEYDMSKAALNMLTLEYARLYKNAKVNAIAPTWMDTPMVDEDIKPLIEMVSLDRVYDEIKNIIEGSSTGEIKIIR